MAEFAEDEAGSKPGSNAEGLVVILSRSASSHAHPGHCPLLSRVSVPASVPWRASWTTDVPRPCSPVGRRGSVSFSVFTTGPGTNQKPLAPTYPFLCSWPPHCQMQIRRTF